MGREDYTGFTIHSGWYPQLLKGSPKRRFSSKKGHINVSGYNKVFVQTVKDLAKERQEELMSSEGKTVITKMFDMAKEVASKNRLSKALLGVGGLEDILFDAMPAKEKYRGTTWKDFVGAQDYQDRAKKFSIRGTHIWYLQSDSGPKKMAKALLKRPGFKFKEAERWYMRTVNQPMVAWAQDALGLGPELESVDVGDVTHAGDVAEELILKDNKLGMEKPPPVKGGARPRDIKSKSLGEIESTEETIGAHHGLPDDVVNTYIKWSLNTEGQTWEKFMKDEVISEWNTYVKAILDRENKFEKTTVEHIKTTGAKKLSDTSGSTAIAKMNLKQLQKMRHEFAIADIDSKSKDFGTTWKEGIPITERDPHAGTRIYASHNLELKQNYIFKLKSVQYVTALNHTLGLAENAKIITRDEAASFYISQQNHHAHMKMNNSGAATTCNNVTSQGYNSATKGVTHTTNVSFSPKVTEEWLMHAQKLILKKATQKAKKKGGKITKQLQKKAKAQGTYGDIFWALPYISIEEGLYSA